MLRPRIRSYWGVSGRKTYLGKPCKSAVGSSSNMESVSLKLALVNMKA